MKRENSIYIKYQNAVIGCITLFLISALLLITNIYTQALLKKSCESELQLKKEKIYAEELYKCLRNDYLDLQEKYDGK